MADPNWEDVLTSSSPTAVPLLADLVEGSLLDSLLAQGLLSSSHYDELNLQRSSGSRTYTEIAQHIFDLLSTVSSPSFTCFCDILRETDGGCDLLDCLTASSAASQQESEIAEEPVSSKQQKKDESSYLPHQNSSGDGESSLSGLSGSEAQCGWTTSTLLVEIPESILAGISKYVGVYGPTVARILNVEESFIESSRISAYFDCQRHAFNMLMHWKRSRSCSTSITELRQALLYSTCSRKALNVLTTHFGKDVVEEESYSSLEGFQQLKGLISTNVNAGLTIDDVGRILGIDDNVVSSAAANHPHSPVEQAAFVITKWEQTEKWQSNKKERLRSLFLNNDLGRFLKPCSFRKDHRPLLGRYISYLIEKNSYVDILGTKEGLGRKKLELQKVYVALKIAEKSSTYQRYHFKKQLDDEMKAYLKREKGMDADLPEEEYTHLTQKYLSNLPATSNAMLQLKTELKQPSSDDTPVGMALTEHQALVILGDPGIGKTTIVRWFALRLAQAYCNQLDCDEDEKNEKIEVPLSEVFLDERTEISNKTYEIGRVRLPVFVRASDFADYLSDPANKVSAGTNHALVDFIGSRYHCSDHFRGKEVFGNELHEIIVNEILCKRAVVLFDGLDEVKSSRGSVLKAVQDFMEEHILCGDLDEPTREEGKSMPRNQMVVTSRIAGFTPFATKGSEYRRGKGGVTYGYVQKMNQTAIRHFCKNWMEASYLHDCPASKIAKHRAMAARDAADLQRLLCSPARPGLFDLASNPLLLTVLATLHKETKQLPEKRAELYDQVIDFLMNEWESTKKTKLSNSEKNLLIRSFVDLAYNLHSSNNAGYIHKRRLITEFGERYLRTPEDSSDKEMTSDTFILSLFESSGLIREKANETYGFIHLSFQEFFAGRNIVRGNNVLGNIIDKIDSADSRWKEPVLFGLGYACLNWSHENFNSLMSQLIERRSSDDSGLKLHLFLVHALSEFQEGSLSKEVMETWSSCLINSFTESASTRGPDNFTCTQVQRALQEMTEKYPAFKKELMTILEKTIREDPSSCKCCTVTILLDRLGFVELFESDLFSGKLYCDTEELAWPIHALLRRLSSPDPSGVLQVYNDPAISDFNEIGIDSGVTLSTVSGDGSQNTVHSKLDEDLRFLNDEWWDSIKSERHQSQDKIDVYTDGDITEEMSFRFGWVRLLALGSAVTATMMYKDFAPFAFLEEKKRQKLLAVLATFCTCFRPIPKCKMYQSASDLDYVLNSKEDMMPVDPGQEDLRARVRLGLLKLWEMFSWESIVVTVSEAPVLKRSKELFDLMSDLPLEQVDRVMKMWAICSVSVGYQMAQSFSDQFEKNPSIYEEAKRLTSHLAASIRKLTSEEFVDVPEVIVDKAKGEFLKWRHIEELKDPVEAVLSLLDCMERCQGAIDSIIGNSLLARLERSEQRLVEQKTELRRTKLNSLKSKRKLGGRSKLSTRKLLNLLAADNGEVFSSLKKDEILIRAFLVLYGGIAVFNYPEAVRDDQTVEIRKTLSDVEQEHLKDLLWLHPYELSDTVARQLLNDISRRDRTLLPLAMYKEIKPLVRLSYVYRGESTFDGILLEILKSTDCKDALLNQAVFQAKEKLSKIDINLLEVHDAALFLCAVGRLDELLQLPFSKTAEKAVDSALAEALFSLSDSACRSWMQLMTVGNLENFLNSSDGAFVLKKLVEGFMELGGCPYPDFFIHLYQHSENELVCLYLAAEVLGCVLTGVKKENGDMVSFDDFLNLLSATSMQIELTCVLLTLPETCVFSWWGRKNSLVLPQLSSVSQTALTLTETINLDLLNILRGIFALDCQAVSRARLLSLLQPKTDSKAIRTLWKAIKFCIEAKDAKFQEWTTLAAVRDDLEEAVLAAIKTSSDGVWAQALIILIEFSPEKRNGLFQLLVSVVTGLQNRLEAFQLIWWALPFVSFAAKQRYVNICRDIALSNADLLFRGRCLVRLAFRAGLLERKSFLLMAIECLNRSLYRPESDTLLSTIRELQLLMNCCYFNEVSLTKAYNTTVKFMPDHLRRKAMSLLHPVGEKLLSNVPKDIEDYEFASTLYLAFLLRDALVCRNRCSVLRCEVHLWMMLTRGGSNEIVEDLAFKKMKDLINCGPLDLTIESALCLESLIIGRKTESEKASQLISYIRPSSLDGIEIVSAWMHFTEVSENIQIAAALNWAEVYGLDSHTLKIISKCLVQGNDVFRLRAAKVFFQGVRPYYTAFEDGQFLLSIYRSLDLANGRKLCRWIWHNDVSFFDKIVSMAGDKVDDVKDVGEFMIENLAAVDEDVGERLRECLCGSLRNLPNYVRKKLLASVCNLCFLDGKGNISATGTFFERISMDLASSFCSQLTNWKVRLYSASALELLNEALYCLPLLRDKLKGKSGISNLDQSETCRRKLVNIYHEIKQKQSPDLGNFLLEGKEKGVKATLGCIGQRKYSWSIFPKMDNRREEISGKIEKCDHQVLDVLSEWAAIALTDQEGLEIDFWGFPSAHVEDLLLCLGAVAKHSPSAFQNMIKRQENKQVDLCKGLNSVLQSNLLRSDSCESVLAALASLKQLSAETAKSFLLFSRQEINVARAAFSEAKKILSADDDALTLLGESLKSASSLEVLMSARLILSMTSHNQLTSSQRSTLFVYLKEAIATCQYDKPLYPMWLLGKAFNLRSLQSVLSETLAVISKNNFKENFAIPHQLGKPDARGVYSYVAPDSATTIWYKYRPSRKCWYWTPYSKFDCWMSVSTVYVNSGYFGSFSPIPENQHLIQFLNQVNPQPPISTAGYDDEDFFGKETSEGFE